MAAHLPWCDRLRALQRRCDTRKGGADDMCKWAIWLQILGLLSVLLSVRINHITGYRVTWLSLSRKPHWHLFWWRVSLLTPVYDTTNCQDFEVWRGWEGVWWYTTPNHRKLRRPINRMSFYIHYSKNMNYGHYQRQDTRSMPKKDAKAPACAV